MLIGSCKCNFMYIDTTSEKGFAKNIHDVYYVKCMNKNIEATFLYLFFHFFLLRTLFDIQKLPCYEQMNNS